MQEEAAAANVCRCVRPIIGTISGSIGANPKLVCPLQAIYRSIRRLHWPVGQSVGASFRFNAPTDTRSISILLE